MENRIVTENSYEEYFENFSNVSPKKADVVKDVKRGIYTQNIYFDGLSLINTQFLALRENDIDAETTPLADLFPEEYKELRDFFATHLHQGSLADVMHNYYLFSCLDRKLNIPGDEFHGKLNKKHSIYRQKNKSAIYIEEFDVPTYTRESNREDRIYPIGRPMFARLVSITLLIPGEKPQLITHKIYVMKKVEDKNDRELLFPENSPHIVKCYDKSLAEVEAEIDALKLPYQIYGTLESYNKLFPLEKVNTSSSLFTENWEKIPVEMENALLIHENGANLYRSLSSLHWEHFVQPIIKERFKSYYEIANRLKDSPPVIDSKEIKELDALKKYLDAYNITYSEGLFDNLKKDQIPTEALKEFFSIQFNIQKALKRAENDINHFYTIIQTILKNIVLLTFEKVCSNLEITSSKCENELMKTAHAFLETLNRIKQTNEFSIEELADHIIPLVSYTELLACHLNNPKSNWTCEEVSSHINLYNNELTKYKGKYQKSSTVSKATTTLGSLTSTIIGALSTGVASLPALPALATAPVVGSILASVASLGFGPLVLAAPLVPALGATAYGLWGIKQAKKGELWKAGENVLHAANAALKRMPAYANFTSIRPKK